MSRTYDASRPMPEKLRTAVKAAICAHPDWRSYMASRKASDAGFNSGKLTTAEIWGLAGAFGIDVDALKTALDNAPDTPEAQAPDAPDTPEAQAPASPVGGDASPYAGQNPDALLNDLVAPVAPWVSPNLVNDLRGKLAPVVAELVKPVQVREVVRTVTKTVTINADADADPLPQVTRAGEMTVAQTLELKGAKKDLQIWRDVIANTKLPVYACAQAPALDPDYVWQPELAACLAVSDANGLNLWAAGPAGTGKTEGAAQWAARWGRPFVRIAINRTTEPADLIGQTLPAKSGGTVWRDGPLTRAFRTEGCVVLIDEPTLLRPGSMAVFQTVLDTGKIFLPTGEVVERAPGVLVIAADNTTGAGDETGRYADTSPMNVALVDRFALMCKLDYLPEGREAQLLAAKTMLDANACALMVSFATLTRKGADGGSLTMGLTLRRLLAWARAVRAGIPSQHAFRLSIMTQADPADREALRQMEVSQGTALHGSIDAYARGVTPETATPEGAAATDAGQRAADAFANAPAF